MTEVQENNSRTRWPFGRRDRAGSTATEDRAPRGRWFGPGTRPEQDTEVVDHDDRTTVVERDPDIGRRRRVASQARLRDRFGGRKVGAAFFGWLVAVGMTVLLSTLATAVGMAIGSTMNLDPTGADAAPIGLTGGAVLLAVLAVSYLAGGYVAGRLARFDGARNGLLCWVIGLLVTVLAAVAGAWLGTARADLVADLRLPALVGDPGTLTVAGVIALAAVLLVTAVAAALGGRLGEGYHRRVDRAAERL
jgi:hypothetical protein